VADWSMDTRNYLARKFFVELLGREPTVAEQAFRAEQIHTSGVDVTYSDIYDSVEGKAFRKRRGW